MMRDRCGLTLIELLLTLAVLATLLLAGVPAFRDLQLNQQMTAQINALVHAVFMAKQTAHTRLTETVLCRSASGLQCEQEAGWSDGWLLFANQDRDHPPHVDAGEPILAVGAGYRRGTIRANRRAFVFRAFEIRSTNGTFVFCDARGTADARALIISYSGRPRTAARRADGRPLRCQD